MGQISEDVRFQEGRNSLGIPRSWWAKLAWGFVLWAVKVGFTEPGNLPPITAEARGSHLPALSGTKPRILNTVPTRMPSGSEVLWGTFCSSQSALDQPGLVPGTLPGLESNEALALATRMETRLPRRPTRGSRTSPSYLVRNHTLGPPLENSPEIPPSSRDEGLRLLHGLATNLATSLPVKADL